jgi:hypothetical protein
MVSLFGVVSVTDGVGSVGKMRQSLRNHFFGPARGVTPMLVSPSTPLLPVLSSSPLVAIPAPVVVPTPSVVNSSSMAVPPPAPKLNVVSPSPVAGTPTLFSSSSNTHAPGLVPAVLTSPPSSPNLDRIESMFILQMKLLEKLVAHVGSPSAIAPPPIPTPMNGVYDSAMNPQPPPGDHNNNNPYRSNTDTPPTGVSPGPHVQFSPMASTHVAATRENVIPPPVRTTRDEQEVKYDGPYRNRSHFNHYSSQSRVPNPTASPSYPNDISYPSYTGTSFPSYNNTLLDVQGRPVMTQPNYRGHYRQLKLVDVEQFRLPSSGDGAMDFIHWILGVRRLLLHYCKDMNSDAFDHEHAIQTIRIRAAVVSNKWGFDSEAGSHELFPTFVSRICARALGKNAASLRDDIQRLKQFPKQSIATFNERLVRLLRCLEVVSPQMHYELDNTSQLRNLFVGALLPYLQRHLRDRYPDDNMPNDTTKLTCQLTIFENDLIQERDRAHAVAGVTHPLDADLPAPTPLHAIVPSTPRRVTFDNRPRVSNSAYTRVATNQVDTTDDTDVSEAESELDSSLDDSSDDFNSSCSTVKTPGQIPNTRLGGINAMNDMARKFLSLQQEVRRLQQDRIPSSAPFTATPSLPSFAHTNVNAAMGSPTPSTFFCFWCRRIGHRFYSCPYKNESRVDGPLPPSYSWLKGFTTTFPSDEVLQKFRSLHFANTRVDSIQSVSQAVLDASGFPQPCYNPTSGVYEVQNSAVTASAIQSGENQYRCNGMTCRVLVPGTINGHPIPKILDDSGADFSIISMDLARRCGVAVQEQVFKVPFNCADGVKSLDMIGTATIEVTLGKGEIFKCHTPFTLFVASHLNGGIILGNNFNLQYGAVIDYQKLSLSFNGSSLIPFDLCPTPPMIQSLTPIADVPTVVTSSTSPYSFLCNINSVTVGSSTETAYRLQDSCLTPLLAPPSTPPSIIPTVYATRTAWITLVHLPYIP